MAGLEEIRKNLGEAEEVQRLTGARHRRPAQVMEEMD
jgi:hypothetical protein